jgi:hypothetical protein
MRTDLFDFELPADLIALRPSVPRDAARLLVVRPCDTPCEFGSDFCGAQVDSLPQSKSDLSDFDHFGWRSRVDPTSRGESEHAAFVVKSVAARG